MKLAASFKPIKVEIETAKYRKYDESDRLKIGKFASEHGLGVAMKAFQGKYEGLKYTTVQVFRNRYWENQASSKKKNSRTKKSMKAAKGKFSKNRYEFILNASTVLTIHKYHYS